MKHLGGGGDLGDGDLEMPAAGEDLLEPALLVGGQVIGAQPRKHDPPDLRRRPSERGGSDLTPWP